MAKKQKDIRTLPDGNRVHHRPDGKVFLLPGQSRLRQRLREAHPAHREARAQLVDRHHELVARKRASLAAHPAVPASKRCC
jgi:hypothetical protein